MRIGNIPARKPATIKLITTRRWSPGLRDSPMRVRLAAVAAGRSGPAYGSPAWLVQTELVVLDDDCGKVAGWKMSRPMRRFGP
jgi:hypothetical protein